MIDNYILNGTTAVCEPDLAKWSAWNRNHDKTIALDWVDDLRISTVFLGMDVSLLPGEPPLLFETMVFQGQKILDMQRYPTWEEAQAGHGEWMKRCRKGRTHILT